MATSTVHLLTIVGERPAADVEATCEALLARRLELCRQDPEDCANPLGWTHRDEPDLRRFGTAMLDRAYELPIYAYSQYVLNYAMGCYLLRELTWPDGRTRVVGGLNVSIAWCRSADYAHHRADADAKLADRVVCPSAAGDHALYIHLKLAMETVLYADRPSLVLVIERCIGSTREDFEVDAAMTAPFDFGATEH